MSWQECIEKAWEAKMGLVKTEHVGGVQCTAGSEGLKHCSTVKLRGRIWQWTSVQCKVIYRVWSMWNAWGSAGDTHEAVCAGENFEYRAVQCGGVEWRWRQGGEAAGEMWRLLQVAALPPCIAAPEKKFRLRFYIFNVKLKLWKSNNQNLKDMNLTPVGKLGVSTNCCQYSAE